MLASFPSGIYPEVILLDDIIEFFGFVFLKVLHTDFHTLCTC